MTPVELHAASPVAAPERARPGTVSPLTVAALAVLFSAAMIHAGWYGYLATDDMFYARAAAAWLHQAPFLGQTQWALRHLIVLPMAAVFAVFGQSEATLAAPMLAYGIALLLMTGLCVRQIAGPRAGALAAVLVVSAPAFASGATVAYTDVPEAFFVLASYWSFHFALGAQRRGLFIMAGVLAGCGFLTRETTVALLVPYAILFLIGYGGRLNYVWMGAGFVTVAGADSLCLWLMSGNPLWRLHVTLGAVAYDSPYTRGLSAPAGMSDPLGIFALPRPLQAMTLLFANPAIGLLPWFAVPASLCLAWRPVQPDSAAAVRLFALLAACWFGMLSFVFLVLWLIARYQIVTICALSVPAAVLLEFWLRRGDRLKVAAVLLPIMASGLLLASASEHDLMFGEQALAGFMRHEDEPVATDPATLVSARWLLESMGAADRVSAALPGAGGLFFLNHNPRRPLPPDWPVREAPANATVVARFIQQPGVVARLLDDLGASRWIPSVLWRKVHPEPRRAEIVRYP